MTDDGQFGQAIHALLKELGWSHGELTASLVHQALAQVRHLRKQADKMTAMTTARDEAVAWLMEIVPPSIDAERRIAELRKVGAP